MCLFVYIEQIFRIDVGVPLSRRETRMAQQLLNRSQIAAALQQMRGEGVPQGMGTRFGSDPCPDQTTRYDSTNRAVGEGPSARALEYRISTGCSGPRANISTYSKTCRDTERNPSFFSPFSQNSDRPVSDIQIIHDDPNDFGTSHAGRVQQLKDGSISLF